MPFYTDFIGVQKVVELIKENLPEGIEVINEYERPYQYHLEINREKKKMVVFYDKNNETHINFDGLGELKEDILSKLESVFHFSDLNTGERILPYSIKIYNKELQRSIKKTLKDFFKAKIKEYKSIDEHVYLLKLKGNVNIVQEKSGVFSISGKSTTLSDKAIEIVEEELRKFKEKNKINRKQLMVNKIPYDEFLRKFVGLSIVSYVSKKVYDFLDGVDVRELEDGLLIYSTIKEKRPNINNYKTLIRSFCIVAEGFLIKLFLELGLISREIYNEEPTIALVGKYIKSFRKQYFDYYKYKSQHYIIKFLLFGLNIGNKYLHSDKFYLFEVKTIEDAEIKIREIFNLLDEVITVFEEKLNETKRPAPN